MTLSTEPVTLEEEEEEGNVFRANVTVSAVETELEPAV
jgi:hypothetical protein